MAVVILVVAVVVVFAIAAVVIGREAHRLDALPPRLVHSVDEAVVAIADHLPFEVAAAVTEDDVHDLVEWHLAALRFQGLGTALDLERRQDQERPVTIDEQAALDRVMEQALAAGRDLDAVDVVVVLDLHTAYLRRIGVVGGPMD